MTSFPPGKRPKKAKDEADVTHKKDKDDLFGVQNKIVKKLKKKALKKTEKVDNANFVVAVKLVGTCGRSDGIAICSIQSKLQSTFLHP